MLGVDTHYVRRESCLIDINSTQISKSEAIDIFLIILAVTNDEKGKQSHLQSQQKLFSLNYANVAVFSRS